MYLSIRGILVRNVAAAVVNGAISLMLLLIAPLGLAAVITNTVLISASTFLVCGVADLVVVWLLNASPRRDIPRFRDRYYREDYGRPGSSIEPRKYDDE